MRRLLTGLKQRHTDLNYGREIIARWAGSYVRELPPGPVRVLDVGCGRRCTDLLNVRAAAPGRQLELYGVEHYGPNVAEARSRGVTVFPLDIERRRLPVADGSFDLVIANQIIEHAKEIFWIFGELSRLLRPGGVLLLGVPNLASLHNRLLLLGGEQPSTIEPLGPHVRGFTAPALTRFAQADGYFRVEQVAGSNFYPFPPMVSRLLSRAFPRASVTIFLKLRRLPKHGNFVQVLDTRFYETAYFKGDA